MFRSSQILPGRGWDPVVIPALGAGEGRSPLLLEELEVSRTFL